MFWLVAPVVAGIYATINQVASINNDRHNRIQSMFSDDNKYVPTFGSVFFMNQSYGPIIEQQWDDNSNIISVDACRQQCSTPILKRMGYFHLYLIIKTANKKNYKVHRQHRFIIEDPKHNKKLGEFITHCRPKTQITIRQLRQQIKKINTAYNVVTNNCFNFGAWVMRKMNCPSQASLIESIRYNQSK